MASDPNKLGQVVAVPGHRLYHVPAAFDRCSPCRTGHPISHLDQRKLARVSHRLRQALADDASGRRDEPPQQTVPPLT
ncbi:hypothetical protein ON010_g14127 [Phytophthora cinnamomi]|nr:hypothetical protein ON010_g14127 [Phytophthora cinnamomi]